ncbi:hypothetical protein CRENBAI_003062 [Crenichthys baileyi]|uniref:Uncharacterized protein n=1 Tax=Crenichthys baileyi TaxID=28760 RepID=A0AAV9S620_9TELE
MRAARRRCRGSQRRGTLYNLFDSNIKFYQGRGLKPQRPLPLTRMMVSQKSHSQEIPRTSSQLCPVLLLLLQKDPVYRSATDGVGVKRATIYRGYSPRSGCPGFEFRTRRHLPNVSPSLYPSLLSAYCQK